MVKIIPSGNNILPLLDYPKYYHLICADFEGLLNQEQNECKKLFTEEYSSKILPHSGKQITKVGSPDDLSLYLYRYSSKP